MTGNPALDLHPDVKTGSDDGRHGGVADDAAGGWRQQRLGSPTVGAATGTAADGQQRNNGVTGGVAAGSVCVGCAPRCCSGAGGSGLVCLASKTPCLRVDINVPDPRLLLLLLLSTFGSGASFQRHVGPLSQWWWKQRPRAVAVVPVGITNRAVVDLPVATALARGTCGAASHDSTACGLLARHPPQQHPDGGAALGFCCACGQQSDSREPRA